MINSKKGRYLHTRGWDMVLTEVYQRGSIEQEVHYWCSRKGHCLGLAVTTSTALQVQRRIDRDEKAKYGRTIPVVS